LRLRHLFGAVKHLGPRWAGERALWEFKRRSGWLRYRLPRATWEERPLSGMLRIDVPTLPEEYRKWRSEHAANFLFAIKDRSEFCEPFVRWEDSRPAVIGIADRIVDGEIPIFAHRWIHVGGPSDWHRNPLTGDCSPQEQHWSAIGDFEHGDVRAIWEASRFGCVFPLARAYWRTGETRYAEAFWQLVQCWKEGNPPQQGVHWKCGQEASLRVINWCFGLWAFEGSSATTAERVVSLIQMIAIHGSRIESCIQYAQSQRNNHAISEAAGLWTIGVLFPELKHADRWHRNGQRRLEELGRQLIYNDGSFAQHSWNYQRLALQVYLWCLRIGALNERNLNAELRRRISCSGNLLYQLQDGSTGQVPNFGQNDGSDVFRLTSCQWADPRPLIQALHYLGTGRRCFDAGPWDESLLWFFGPEALQAPVHVQSRNDLAAEDGGLYTMRGEHGFAMVRCSAFRHRPSQADQLHVDIWWRGLNMALDPGTFSYNSAPPWQNPLARTRSHNTVSVDGLDQMDRAGRFLLLPWANGRATTSETSAESRVGLWHGEHEGYRRLAQPVSTKRSLVRIGGEHWIVVDRLDSSHPHSYQLHWLLLDNPNELDRECGRLELTTPSGPFQVLILGEPAPALNIVRADPESPTGWRSPAYLERVPALSLTADVHADNSHFVSVLGPPPLEAHLNQLHLEVRAGELAVEIELNAEAEGTPVAGVQIFDYDSESTG